MKAADLAHLRTLYAATDDPWNFRGSPYEARRLADVVRALPRPRYAAALELGCGNGELARRIAPRCDTYTGLDAVPTAIGAARMAVPDGRFVEAFLPCPLPDPPDGGSYDLVLLSEVLYFLDATAIRDLAALIDRNHPGADILAVNWLGATGHAPGGTEAVAAYTSVTPRAARTVRLTQGYRIDSLSPLTSPCN